MAPSLRARKPNPPPSQGGHSRARAPAPRVKTTTTKVKKDRDKLRERRNARRTRAKAKLSETRKYKRASLAKKKELLDAEFAVVEKWYQEKLAAEADEEEEEEDNDGEEDRDGESEDVGNKMSGEAMSAGPAGNSGEEEGLGEEGQLAEDNETSVEEHNLSQQITEGMIAVERDATDVKATNGKEDRRREEQQLYDQDKVGEEVDDEEVRPLMDQAGRMRDEEQDDFVVGPRAGDMLGGQPEVWEQRWVDVEEGYGDLLGLVLGRAAQIAKMRPEGF